MRPSPHSKMNALFAHFSHTHTEKEQFLQLIGRDFCWSLNCFFLEIVVKHSCVKFVLTAQRSACSISISIVLLCCQIWIVCFHAQLDIVFFFFFAPVVHSSHSLVEQRSKKLDCFVLFLFFMIAVEVFSSQRCAHWHPTVLWMWKKSCSAGLLIRHGGFNERERGHCDGVKPKLPSLVSVGVGKG